MQGFKNYMEIVTAFILTATLIMAILPQGDTKSVVKFVISVMLMGIILAPILKLKKTDITADSFEYTRNIDEIRKADEIVSEKVEWAVILAIKEFASEKSISDAKVYAVKEEGKIKEIVIDKRLFGFKLEISDIIGVPQEYIKTTE